MQRRNFLFLIAGLTSLWLFDGSTWADDPKAEPDKRPQLVAQLGHSNAILSVAFSPDGRFVLTGSADKTARLWEAATGKEVRVFRGHEDDFSGVTFSPDGRFVLTGSSDKTARLWEAATGKEVRVFRGHEGAVSSVAFSPDGRFVLTGSFDKTARLWEAATGKEVRVFRGLEDEVLCVAFSPDGRFVLTGSFDKTARLWEAATGKEVRVFRGHEDDVYGVAFSPDGRFVLTGSFDKTARLWEAATGKEVRVFRGHEDDVYGVAFSPDGRFVLTASNKTARLWEAATGKEVRVFRGHESEVTCVAFSPNGRWVLTGGENLTPRLWEVATGKEVRSFGGSDNLVLTVAFSPDGRFLLTGDLEKTARLWESATGREVRSFRGHKDGVSSVAFSPDGRFVLTGSLDKTVRLWEAATGKEIRVFRGHDEEVHSVTFSPDSCWVLTGSEDETARLWETATGKEVRSFRGHHFSVSSVAFSPDGRLVLTGGWEGTARLWEAATGKEVQDFRRRTGSVYSVAFSPDGHWLLIGGANKTARLEVATGKETCAFLGHERVNSVAISPDGRFVLTGSKDMTARLWEAATGKEVRVFRGHEDDVSSVAFSPNGRFVMTGSSDKTARLWDMATGKELCRLVSFRDGAWAVVDPDGRFDAANGGDVEGLHWVVGNEAIALKQFKERYYEPGLLAKKLGFNKEPLRDVPRLGVRLFPTAEILEAPKGTSRTMKIRLTNRGGGIGKVQVFVNGKEMLADARGPKPDPDAALATLSIDLAGAPVVPGKNNSIEVVTWNAEGYMSSLGSSRGSKLAWAPEGTPPEDPPELYAIVAGINTYANPDLHCRFAAQDAENVGRVLTVAAGKLFGTERVHLTVLSSSGNKGTLSPSKANFRAAFEAASKARTSDILLVYLAGHGVTVAGPDGVGLYCYLTREARSLDPGALKDPGPREQTCLTSDELAEWTRQVPALKQVLVLDTCAAGAARTRLVEGRAVPSDQVIAIERLKDRMSFYVLMGCAADQASYEASAYGQGVLTYALLEGMKGAALRDERFVDVSKLFHYARERVPRLARNVGGVQQPHLAAPRGDSFDLGLLGPEDRKVIPLAMARPHVLRPRLLNKEEDFDDLRLEDRLHKRLDEDSYLSVRGAPPPLIYVKDGELPGALRPSGTYTVSKGGEVQVRVRLIRDGQSLKVLEVKGRKSDLPGLAARLAAAVTEAAQTVGPPTSEP